MFRLIGNIVFFLWELTKVLLVIVFGIFIFGMLGACEHHVEPEPVERVVSLPEKCAPYYNDGTERWIDCMGVGYQ